MNRRTFHRHLLSGLGAAALDLAFVASGRLDAFWERGLNAWDLGAGIVLVREAGGFVSDLSGADGMLDKGSVCAGNEYMHRALLALNHQLQRERWRTNALRRMLHDCGVDDATIETTLAAQP